MSNDWSNLDGVIRALPQPLFAVLDGAHFDDIEDELADLGISSRSLFLSGGDEDMRRDGPWLVSLSDERTLRHIEELAFDKRCAVFWSCAPGDEALWRHLRSINEVLIATDPSPESRSRGEVSDKYERVLFRHWDPNVLKQVLPTLDKAQFMRFFGPAEVILFLPSATWAEGTRKAVRPEGAVAPPGPLRIDRSNVETIERTRSEVADRQILSYLRESLPPQFSQINDTTLFGNIQEATRTARGYGVAEHAALCRWSYLYVVTNGAINHDQNIRKFMTSQKFAASPDVKVRQVMDAMIYGLREKAKCL